MNGKLKCVCVVTGWGFVSNSWEFRASCYDGTRSRSSSTAHVEESRVSDPVSVDSLALLRIKLEDLHIYVLFWCVYQPTFWEVC